MKYSINKLKSIKNRFDARIDAEFYLPHYAEIDKTLNKHNCKNLAELTYKITDGTHYTPQYVTKGTPFLSAINVKENFLDLDCGYQYITSSEHNVLYKRCAPRAGDILLRKVGVGPRYATVVPNDIFEFSLFVSVALLKPKDINFYYLSTFINSKYGQIQLLRFNKGISQPDLHLEDIETLLVPILDNGFQNLIENIVKISLENKKIVKELLSCSDELLLKNLNLINWRPEHKLYSIKKYSDVKNVNRFDAEYFQPKYDEILGIITQNSYTNLGNEFDILRNSGLVYDQDGKNGVIKTKQIKENFIDYNIEDRTNQGDSNTIVKDRDVLFASMGVGSLGKTNIYYNFENEGSYIIDSTLKIFRAKIGGNISPEYLEIYLHSRLAQELIYQNIVGSSGIISIYESYLQNLPIPIIDKKTEEQIIKNIRNAHLFNYQSKQLLEIAKRGVEIAIEENEDIATKWINEQLLKLGINLN